MGSNSFADGIQRHLASWDPAQLIGQEIGNYLVGEKIGEGGMGIVYAGEQKNLRRKIAFKILNPNKQNQDWLLRFQREGQLSAKLNHPNIVQVYDFNSFEEADRTIFYLVMEYVDGKTLREILAERTCLPPAETIEIMSQCLKALSVIHAEGIIHRDLKPGNIMLVRTEAGWQAKLCDFGVCKEIDAPPTPAQGDAATMVSPLTKPNQMPGTAEYMAPEQFGNGHVDQRADLYAMGIILYQMLTGAAPFRSSRQDVVSLIAMHRKVAPPPMWHRVKGIPLPIEKAVLKALEKDPARRYSSAGEMAEGLNASVRAVRQAENHRNRFGTALAATIGTVGALILAGYLANGSGILDRFKNNSVTPAQAGAQGVPPDPLPPPEPVRVVTLPPEPVQVPDPPSPPPVVSAPKAEAPTFDQVKRLIGQYRYKEGAAMCEVMLKEQPKHAELWYLLGTARARLGLAKEADDAYLEFLKYGNRRDVRYGVVKTQLSK